MMEKEDTYLLDDVEDDLLTELATAELIQNGLLLCSCAHCGTFLEPAEALSSCPACQTEVWPDHVVVRLTSQLPEC
jgi:rubrerythrin